MQYGALFPAQKNFWGPKINVTECQQFHLHGKTAEYKNCELTK